MNKRTVLALGLSFLVLMVWSKLFSVKPSVPIQNQEATQAEVFKQEQALTQPVEQLETPKQETSVVEAVSETSLNELELTIAEDKDKGFILSVIPGKYGQALTFHNIFKLNSTHNVLFDKQLQEYNRYIDLLYSSDSLKISHSIRNSGNPFIFNSLVTVENKEDNVLNDNIWLSAGSINLEKRDIHSRFVEAFIITESGIIRFNPFGKTPTVSENIKAIGLRDRHFCTVIKPLTEERFGFHLTKHDKNHITLYLSIENIVINPKKSIQLEFGTYIGPQLPVKLEKLGDNIGQIVNFGFFDPISKTILFILRAFFVVSRNWGVAIILLSAVLFFVVYPLTAKQMNSLKRMQEIQPEIEKIRKAYKDNPQKLNKEMLEIYKKYKINPAGGCLPMLLQIPIFFALYQALLRSVEIYGANFLWIKDLSEPDKLSLFGGGSINLLPLIMAVGMFFQQKISQQKSSGAMAEQQKMMVWIMPIMFGFIFYNFPSGLVLYWLCNSVFTTIAQWKTLKK